MYLNKKNSEEKESFRRLSLRSSSWMLSVIMVIGSTTYANTSILKTENVMTYNRIAHLQERTIQGVVKDSNTGEPLAGVTVEVSGTNKRTATSSSGTFEIQASNNDILIFTYVGYEVNRTTIDASTSNLTISLIGSFSDLEEVVVTGYGTQRKKDLTGSVSVVDVDQLKSQPAATAVEALQGKAPGVQIVNDGAPGSTPQIKIRGYSTINNNEP